MIQANNVTRTVISAFLWLCLTTQASGSQVATSSTSSLNSSSSLCTSTSGTQTTNSSETQKRAAAKNLVVFGLTEVLLGHSVWEITKKLGWRIVSTLWDPQLPDRMRKKRADVLNAVSKEKSPFLAGGDDQGNPMSRIMFEQQAGVKTPQATMQEINDTITKLASQAFFSSDREKTLVTNLINTVDNPDVYIHCMEPLKGGLELVELCSQNPANELMILSNFGGGMLEQLQKLYPDMFKHFKAKNIVLAGDISEADRKQYFSSPLHVIKPGGPDGEIFRYVEIRTGYQGPTITFIGDQEIDAETSKKRGWQSLQVKGGDFASIKKALLKLGIIKDKDSLKGDHQ